MWKTIGCSKSSQALDINKSISTSDGAGYVQSNRGEWRNLLMPKFMLECGHAELKNIAVMTYIIG